MLNAISLIIILTESTKKQGPKESISNAVSPQRSLGKICSIYFFSLLGFLKMTSWLGQTKSKWLKTSAFIVDSVISW